MKVAASQSHRAMPGGKGVPAEGWAPKGRLRRCHGLCPWGQKNLFIAGMALTVGLSVIWAGCMKKNDSPTTPQSSIPANQATYTPTPFLAPLLFK